jgi:hypothetical protein
VTFEKSRSRPGVENDHTGAQLPPHDLQFPCRTAPQRQLACAQMATILNCTRTMWKNERQAGETTDN